MFFNLFCHFAINHTVVTDLGVVYAAVIEQVRVICKHYINECLLGCRDPFWFIYKAVQVIDFF